MMQNMNLWQSFLLILYLFVKANIPTIYLDNCVYKIVNKQMADYLDENLFETDDKKVL